MTREEKLKKAHQMFDNRNLITELKWQREYFRRGYISNQEELFNLWIFDECIKALEQEPRKDEVILTNKEYRELISNEYDNGYCKGYAVALEEQEHIIDKIRAEIMQLDYDIESVDYDYNDMPQTEEVHMICREEVLQILDKYKGESEG